MQTVARRRAAWTIAASVLAHLAVVAFALSQHVTLPPPRDDAGPPLAFIPVLILPRVQADAGGLVRPGQIRLHRREPSIPQSLPLAPREAAETPAERLSAPSAASAAPAPSGADQGPPAPDLTAALRHGVLGCANAGALSREDRIRCEEQLGAGAANAPTLQLQLAPRMRAYYDAVAKAKAPDKPWTPNRAPGALGRLDPEPRNSSSGDHLPGVGCVVPFGPGKKPTHKQMLPHALWLGPCFIEPPKGPLDPEVDIPVP
ncbi:hypothetical protein [Phenylobacterium sp.]|uniref:hypothetical protein n=1 Tax=Phenylobacterium sp. TaxID=1871053 RepID=UPI00121159BB|nr:hypothetical protein [Phenylobacterium sp.]THD64151.1 MAG: hypothetical protein E8A49_03190 [Phenylobacterium sp.]